MTANTSINQTQDDIVGEFAVFDQWMDKYEYLIELGRQLPLIDAAHKTDDHLIRGCQSQVWLHAQLRDGAVRFTADSDAVITKGIIALLVRVLADQRPEDIAAADLYFIDAIGLREHLSSTRSNGLVNMVRTLKSIGKKFSQAH
ncbi:MAG: SufE family protein [bacterium]